MKKYSTVFWIAFKSNIKTVMYILIFIGISFLVATTVLKNYINVDNISKYRDDILLFNEENRITSVIIYMIISAILISITPPAYVAVTTISGMIFGVFAGTIFTAVSSSGAAVMTFFYGRYLFKTGIQKRYSKNLEKLNSKLRQNGTIYFFKIRLIPGAPFFLMNLLAGITEVSAKKFWKSTFLGNIPITAAYCYIGDRLSDIRDIKHMDVKQGVDIFINSMILRAVVTLFVVLFLIIYNNMEKKGSFARFKKRFKVE